MDDDLRGLLEENLELARENNAILRKMQRSARMAQIVRVIYWVFLIGSIIGAYYYLEPFIRVITDSYDQIEQSLDNIKNSQDAGVIPPEIQNFFDRFRPSSVE